LNQAIYFKEATAILDYGIDHSDWLDGRTISTSVWTVPTGITKVSESNSTTQTFIKLSGGTWTASYEILNHIVANDGNEQDQSFTVRIQYNVRYCNPLEVRASAQGMTTSASPPASDALVEDLPKFRFLPAAYSA